MKASFLIAAALILAAAAFAFANQPTEEDRQNIIKYSKIHGAILQERHDDIRRYCSDPRDKALVEMKIKGTDTVAAIRFMFDHFGGECAANHGWDNYNASDSHDQYFQAMHAHIRAVWDGDQKWLEHRFCVEEHEYHDNECPE